LAGLLHEGDFRDPALRALNVTVTEVRMSPDLKHATAFVLPLGGHDAAGALAALRHARAHLRSLVGQRVQLRLVPDLHFEIDDSFERAARIRSLLDNPLVRRDVARTEGEGAEPVGSEDGGEGGDEDEGRAGEAERPDLPSGRG